MIVVGDASAIIALQRVGELELLRRMFGQVHVPPAVWREVFSPDVPGALTAPPWILRHALWAETPGAL